MDRQTDNRGRQGSRSGGLGGRAYSPHDLEAHRQAAWNAQDAFATPTPSDGQPRKYIKPSAPFTSGNIHIGHVRSYAIGDAYARFCRARGEAVLFAFGFDAFGLPAELGAIANGVSPSEWVDSCAQHMRSQLERLGFSFDWSRSFMSSDPQMYRWSQWLFLELLDAGLIYRGTGTVDWCDHCETTLASIQVEDGTCWRCHNPVRLIQREQWFLRITRYLEENDRRLTDLASSGKWDENALASQRFVLGRVDGFEITLLDDEQQPLTVFTPHADAVHRAAFVLVSPKHEQIERFAATPGVRARIEQLRSGGIERGSRDAEAIPIVHTGRFVTSAGGDAQLPLLISPAVDGRFGATAALGIPDRDPVDAMIARRLLAEGSFEKGAVGQPPAGAGEVPLAAQIRHASRYKAGDFSISRQRSWGTPIPIVYCERCGTVKVPPEDLPVLLPADLKPTGTGNPLAELEEFVSVSCPSCGGPARRETDTLDCHFDALWLWVPACVPPSERHRPLPEILALEDLRVWLPSERVVAGSDSGSFVFDQRIVTKALRDIGPLQFLADGEPFAGCLFHEMVMRDGRKMSKHLGNVVDPDALVSAYGADTMRLAVLYAARPQKALNWTDSAVQHCERFLVDLWQYCRRHFEIDAQRQELPSAELDVGTQRTEHLRKRLSQWCETALERMSADMAALQMHSAVRNVMRLFERMKDFEGRVLERRGTLSRQDSESLIAAIVLLVQMLFPLAPHISEQLWIDSGSGAEGEHPRWPTPAAHGRDGAAATAPAAPPPAPTDQSTQRAGPANGRAAAPTEKATRTG